MLLYKTVTLSKFTILAYASAIDKLYMAFSGLYFLSFATRRGRNTVRLNCCMIDIDFSLFDRHYFLDNLLGLSNLL